MDLCAQGDYSRALAAFTSTEEKPSARCLCNIATCHFKLECFRKCITAADAALSLDSALLEAYLLKGRAYAAMGKAKKAQKAFKSALGAASCRSDCIVFAQIHEALAQGGTINSATKPDSSTADLHGEQKEESTPKTSTTLWRKMMKQGGGD